MRSVSRWFNSIKIAPAQAPLKIQLEGAYEHGFCQNIVKSRSLGAILWRHDRLELGFADRRVVGPRRDAGHDGGVCDWVRHRAADQFDLCRTRRGNAVNGW